MRRVAATVRGRVQGVGFRFFALDTAQELGIAGWVRNADDGSVELEAEGDEWAVGRFLDEMGRGPSLAGVVGVESHDIAVRGERGFSVRY